MKRGIAANIYKRINANKQRAGEQQRQEELERERLRRLNEEQAKTTKHA